MKQIARSFAPEGFLILSDGVLGGELDSYRTQTYNKASEFGFDGRIVKYAHPNRSDVRNVRPTGPGSSGFLMCVRETWWEKNRRVMNSNWKGSMYKRLGKVVPIRPVADVPTTITIPLIEYQALVQNMVDNARTHGAVIK